MSSRWFRLWVLLSSVVVVAVLTASAYYVWGQDACYTFVTVSISDNTLEDDRRLAEAMRKEATERIFCGATLYSPILTLERLAERGTVTQIGVSWLEPNGWSFKDHDMIAVIERNDIKATKIIDRVSGNIRSSRMRYATWFVATSAITSFIILILGFSVSWVRKGFLNEYALQDSPIEVGANTISRQSLAVDR